MNCKSKGYEVGQVFKVVQDTGGFIDKGAILVLRKPTNDDCPSFDVIDGRCNDKSGWIYLSLARVKRIWPPEELSKNVTVVCEGKTVEISRESAKALNLI